MEMDPEVQLVQERQLMDWSQLTGYVDPLMVLNDQKDRCVVAVQEEVERLGLTIESLDVHVEVYVKAYAR